DYRLDWVPYLSSFQQSPRGAVLVHPTKKSTFRASVATSYRKPTFLESYLDLAIPLPAAGASQTSQGIRSEDPGFRLRPERILSTEIGYLNQQSDYFVVDTALYWNRVSSLIQMAANRPITVGDIGSASAQNPSTGQFPTGFGGWDNQCQMYDVYGAEA